MYAMENDPITGTKRYRNLQTGEVSADKPLSLGSERWDQEDMMLWTVEEVRGPLHGCVKKRYSNHPQN